MVSAFLLLPILTFAATAKSVRGDGWTISQSSNFAGSVYTQLTANAVRMKIGRFGVTMIAKAPVWTAYLYNDNNKSYCELPKGRWTSQFLLPRSSALRSQQGKSILKSKATGKSMRISGYQANQIEVIRPARPEMRLPEEILTEVWTASDIFPPPEVAELICRHLNVPVQKGVPLRVFNKTRGKMVSVLDTLAIKRGPVPPETFEPMKGYKKVKDEMQLIMEDTGEDMIGGPLEQNTTPAPGAARH
jgi:hypothetical protein